MKATEGRGAVSPAGPWGSGTLEELGGGGPGAGRRPGGGAEPNALTSSFSSRCRSHSCSYMRFPTPVLSRVEMICSCVSLLSMMLYSSIKHRICRDREERHHRLGPRAGLLRKGWGSPTLSLSREPRAPAEGRGRGALRSEVLSSPRPLHDAGGSPAPVPLRVMGMPGSTWPTAHARCGWARGLGEPERRTTLSPLGFPIA